MSEARNAEDRVDVAVVGGGPAGIAAAVAAALGGASVRLIDRGPRLGGNVGNAFVHTICGLYEAADADDPQASPRLANPGLASEFADSLIRMGAAGAPERAGRVWVLPLAPLGFSRLANALCDAAASPEERAPGAAIEAAVSRPMLSLGLGVELAGAEEDPDGFLLTTRAAEGQEHGDWRRTRARIAIDASGDGDLAAALGADLECEGPERLQHPSYIVELEGVDAEELVGFERVRMTAAVARAARQGELPEECQSVVVRPASSFADFESRSSGRDGRLAGARSAGRSAAARDRPGEGAFLTFTFPKPAPSADGSGAYDPLDSGQRRRLGTEARAHAERVVAFLVKTRAGFEHARIARFPERIGVREGRRVLGRHVVDEAHVLGGGAHPDEVARSSWPIELWHAPSGARFQHPSGSCAIALGALVSRTHARLGLAGRCLSATHEAHGALRVVGTALATGEAIGFAAALACEAGHSLGEVAPSAVRAARERHRSALAGWLRAAETRCS